MCELATLMQIGGAALSVGAQVAGGRLSRSAARIQAMAARVQGNNQIASSEYDVGTIAAKGERTGAAQLQYYAANGLDPTFGSPLLAQVFSAGQVATDIEITRASGRLRALGFENQAIAAEAAGKQKQTAAYVGAATSILKAFGSIAENGGFSLGSPSGPSGPLSIGGPGEVSGVGSTSAGFDMAGLGFF